MRRLQWLGWFGLSLYLCVLLGCRPSSAPAEKQKGRLFAVSFQTLNNPFFVSLNDGLKKIIEAHGDRLITLDAQFNSMKQRNDLSDVLQQRPAVLFLNPVNWKGIRGTLLEAQRAHVPVIVVDAPVEDTNLVLCQVASDNVEAGRLAAQELGRLNPRANVAIINDSISKPCIDRVAGFEEVIKKQFPKITLLSTLDAKGTSEAMRPVMRDLLERFPDMDAVFAINDPGAIGCVSAIESAGRAGKVLVFSVDGSSEAAKFIRDGRIVSTSAQFPDQIGTLAAQAAYDHLAGNPVEEEIKVPVELVTKSNAQEFLK